MSNSYCVGCSCYYEDVRGYYYCNLEIANGEGKCPCSHCIVKIMCERACPTFDAFKKAAKAEGFINHELQRPL